MKEYGIHRSAPSPRAATFLVLLFLLLTVVAVGEVAAQPDVGAICEFAETMSGQDFPCDRYS